MRGPICISAIQEVGKKHPDDGKEYTIAVKKINKPGKESKLKDLDIYAEVNIWKALRHPNLVPLYLYSLSFRSSFNTCSSDFMIALRLLHTIMFTTNFAMGALYTIGF